VFQIGLDVGKSGLDGEIPNPLARRFTGTVLRPGRLLLLLLDEDLIRRGQPGQRIADLLAGPHENHGASIAGIIVGLDFAPFVVHPFPCQTGQAQYQDQ